VDYVKGGTTVQLEDVYKLYMNDLYRYLFSLSKDHYVSEDLVQETFYRAFATIEDYEFHHIKAWLFKVAYHAFIDYQRKAKRTVVEDNLDQKLEPDFHTPEKNTVEKESLHLLLKDLHVLNEKEKHAIILCDLHELPYQEASDILELNLNTFKSHLVRGRKKLVERVKERMKNDDR
jgi:RNA polymerase sigma-70 factor (ECF subfamily)